MSGIRVFATLLALLGAAGWGAALAQAPSRLVIVSDVNYPPYLYVDDGGAAQGILKDKWQLWSRHSGVPVEVVGMNWAVAQAKLLDGTVEVIDALAYNEERSRLYEFSPPYAPVEARVFFHQSISGVSDAQSMRGFEMGAKEGSACAQWLGARGIGTIRPFADSREVVAAAAGGDLRLFCMDSPVARFFLHKLGVAAQFRESPPLYTTQFHWAVRKGRAELRDFIQAGFARIPAAQLEEIDARWLGSPVRGLSSEQRHYLLLIIAAVAAAAALLFMWNWALRRQVDARTGELRSAMSASDEWRRRFDSVLSVSHSLMYEVKPGSRAFIWAGDLRDVLGIAPENVPTAAEWIERVHPEDRSMVEGIRARFATGELNSVAREYRLRRDDGSYRYVGVTAYVVPDAERDPGAPLDPHQLRIVGAVRDIDDKKRAEEDKRVLEERLKQAQKMEAIGRFADGIAHDFNNILGAILGYGELAKGRAPAGSDLRRYLETIHTAGERGKSLVSQILTFSRGNPVEKQPVLIAEIIEEVVAQVRGSLPRGVSIRLAGEFRGAVVLGNPTQIHQLAMNLCTNAIQAMPEGGEVQLTVQVEAVEAARDAYLGRLTRGNYVLIEVRDTGTGMDESTKARMFEPFFTTKPTGEGTGLGLSLVQSIALEHGGALDIVTTPGRGTCIGVRLPEFAGDWKRTAAPQRDLPRGTGQTVLVVDDEPALANLAQEMLAELGYEPVAHTSSVEALAAFERDPARYDAVVSDEVMPELTGTQLAARVRARTGVPVLLISGFGGPGFEIRARDAGVSRVLRKPYQKRELAEALAAALAVKA